jgi:outer membrane protein assembly factor BamB
MRLAIGFVLLFLVSTSLAAESSPWPQFRGPNGSGVVEEQKPPVEIGPDKNVKWKVTCPSGMSSPVIAGELIVVTAFDNNKLYTIAYRRSDGKEAWRADARAAQIEAFHKVEGSPAASTPATDGQRIVSYFGSCGLVCYDLAGKELWRQEMPVAEVGGGFGSGVSPIIADGLVILVRDTLKDAKIMAFDAATGTVKWEKLRQSPTSYSTPITWTTTAGKQIAVAGHAKLVGYDLASGEEKWSFSGIPSGCCSSPVTADGTLFFAGTSPGGTEEGGAAQMPSFDKMLKDLDKDGDGAISKAEGEQAFGGFFDNQDANKDGKVSKDEWDIIARFMADGKSCAVALKPGGTGDVTASHALWHKTKGLPYVASAILYRGQYVMVRDGGIVTAYDAASGEEVYQKRAVAGGPYYASPIAAGGHLYFTALNDGTVSVLKAGLDRPEVVADNPPLGERVAATPAIADNILYIRTAGHLYAFQ